MLHIVTHVLHAVQVQPRCMGASGGWGKKWVLLTDCRTVKSWLVSVE